MGILLSNLMDITVQRKQSVRVRFPQNDIQASFSFNNFDC